MTTMEASGVPQPAPGAVVSRGAATLPATRARVLIVDDGSRIRLALRSCLELEGYEVGEACDGREALTAVVHFRPDVVLLDLAMPHLDGLSTLRLLGTVYAPVRPKVIVLTAYSSTLMAQAASAWGINAFVEKPILADALHEVVARVLVEPRCSLPKDQD